MFTLKAREGDVINEIKSTLYNESEIDWVHCFFQEDWMELKEALILAKHIDKRTTVPPII